MDDNQRIDMILLLAIVVLAGLGLVMVYSSSMYLSLDKVGSDSFASASLYFRKQALHLVVGFVIMTFLTMVNYKMYAPFGKWLLGIWYLMLVALLAYNEIKGYSVNRWLRIGPLVFQPSEFMKIIQTVFLASVIANMGDRIREFKRGFIPVTAAVLTTFILVFLEPNLGVSGLLLLSGFYILFIGRAKLIHILALVTPAAVAVTLAVTRIPYMTKRWHDFLSSEMAYQIKQSIISIGSGGLFGVGLGNSSQKYNFLPELHTDFVFSIFAEEWGMAGSLFLLFWTFVLVYRGMRIGRQAPDMFGFLLASGLSALIGFQTFINIGVAIRILPTTGMTLPFISYGGSSLLTSFAAAGILLNISKQGNYELKLSREFGTRNTRRAW